MALSLAEQWSTEIPTNRYWYSTLDPKSQGDKFLLSILLKKSSLVIINNTNEKNYCYFPIEKLSGNIFY